MSGSMDRVPATRAIDDTPLLEQPPRAPTATAAASRWAPRNISLECASLDLGPSHAQGQKEKEQHLGREMRVVARNCVFW